ncbi:Glucooligosaccharide oxidase [Neurospora crassa]|uniref:Glucooligosaccharide oxidase n=1 Tax=Neurospora crassa (strain ATCC 24698 / 74-OR23-1A / CBS 708.71 / DSM 1257 / FGSC 987) TaxID=367110 RepID=Q7S1P7_NEUCR|nr:glucooligosaccharide oxidase [Neurospora crassa OR74A]EAA29277.3 glucooligosaccharide oxidase [Neurospora crassa OR74A]KHE81027.1 Glucooligosaccharide oxidase [Neurospora crassa]|eukprot:XP_958513.3 glucooligosaccharide oxidase [Neurospora crassa OR74A]
MWLPLILLTATAAPILANPLSSPLNKRAAIDDCLKSAGVPADAQGSSEWRTDVNPFNQRLPYTPVAIAVPTTIEHIQGAVSCATKLGIKVTPKSGGHSYASFGLGGENGHLVVELDRMSKVTLDKTTNIADVQSGARLGHVATELYKQGKRAFSHGTCPGVGVGGHSLHGGFGFSSHTYGLAVDWIAAATVVLANSTVVTASPTENPDLFWALRGAGSNFGIVASFKFNTFAAPSQVTAFQINLPWNSASSIASGWEKLQDWLAAGNMPKEMNMRVFGSPSQTQLQGLYHGSSSALRTAVQPLLSTLGASLSNAQQYDWMGAFTYYTYGGTVDVTHPYNTVETFYSKSLVTTALPSAALNSVANYWINTAKRVSRDWFIIIDMHGGPKSAITSSTTNSANYTSSYAYRAPEYLFLYELYDRVMFGSYPSNGFSFLDGWVKSFTDNMKQEQWGMYINYADPTMKRAEAVGNYYRSSLSRLQKVKAQYDPNEVFYYPQSVEPAK